MPTVVSFHPRFDKQFDRLARKYRGTDSSVEELVNQLERDERPGQRVPRVGYTLFKVRLPNPAAGRGKSGGFRVIYYVQLADRVTLLTIYSKTDEADISIAEMRRLAQEAEG